MKGYSSEADARLDFVRRVRHALERQLSVDGATQEEIELERPALVAAATFILDSVGYSVEEREDGVVLVFHRGQG